MIATPEQVLGLARIIVQRAETLAAGHTHCDILASQIAHDSSVLAAWTQPA